VPIEMDFTAAQRRVKVVAGYSAPLSVATDVQLTALNASGEVVGTATSTFNPNANPQRIQSVLEVTSAGTDITRATVTLLPEGQPFNNNLTIDAIDPALRGPPPSCTATSTPTVALHQPTDDTVYTNEFLLKGAISTQDQIDVATVTVTGPAGTSRSLDLLGTGLVRPWGGAFGPVRLSELLAPGVNTILVTAQDCRGMGQASGLVVFVLPGPPRIVAAEINQGLPEYPLVAGKSTLARVYVGASNPGSVTRIDRARLDITQHSTGETFTIGAVIPNPIFANITQQYAEHQNINFYIPGDMLPEGFYTFRAYLFNGPQ